MKKEPSDSNLETEVIDIGPLVKMGADKVDPVITNPKDLKAKIILDPVTKAKNSAILIEDRVFMSRLAE